MLVGCPKCKTKYRIKAEKTGTDEILLRCSNCNVVFRVAGKPAAFVQRSTEVSAAGTCRRITVLLANESPDFCRAVKKILDIDPLFDVLTCNDGKSALAIIEGKLPDVVVLDVALPLMYGFQVCEAVRKNPVTAAVKVVLIAAIYDKTRYRREPLSLYGADDYIEKHDIPDLLAAKIHHLVSGRGPVQRAAAAEIPVATNDGVAAQQNAGRGNIPEEIFLDEERESGAVSARGDSEAHVKARRLARLIVSDIVLYNQELVEEGIRTDSFYTILEADILEGRALYEKRISDEIRCCTSYLEEAFEVFVMQKKKEVEMTPEQGEYGG
jgi:predicted Zn finger-like uncharacterized protein